MQQQLRPTSRGTVSRICATVPRSPTVANPSLLKIKRPNRREVSVTIPERALALIDFAAKRAGTSRSEFLTRSALTCVDQDARRNA